MNPKKNWAGGGSLNSGCCRAWIESPGNDPKIVGSLPLIPLFFKVPSDPERMNLTRDFLMDYGEFMDFFLFPGAQRSPGRGNSERGIFSLEGWDQLVPCLEQDVCIPARAHFSWDELEMRKIRTD